MKLRLLYLLLIFTSTQVYAQIQKGQWLAGGGLNFTSGTINVPNSYTVTQREFAISTNGGYFIANGVAIGLTAKYGTLREAVSYVSQNYRDENYSSINAGAGVFMRAYILPNTSSVNFMLHGSYRYGYLESELEYMGLKPSKQYTKTNDLTIFGGPVFFLNSNVALEFVLGYNSQSVIDSKESRDAFFLGVGLQVHLGENQSSGNPKISNSSGKKTQ